MSKKKNVIARVGNFEIHKESGAEHDYIRIKAVGGHWVIMHRDDSPMYGAWLMMCKDPDPNAKKWLEMRIVMEYTMSQSLYDEGFVRDWWKAVDEFNKRRVEAAPIPTEQEEADAIAEVQMMEEVKKEING